MTISIDPKRLASIQQPFQLEGLCPCIHEDMQLCSHTPIHASTYYTYTNAFTHRTASLLFVVALQCYLSCDMVLSIASLLLPCP